MALEEPKPRTRRTNNVAFFLWSCSVLNVLSDRQSTIHFEIVVSGTKCSPDVLELPAFEH
jgi:hypothetical protein